MRIAALALALALSLTGTACTRVDLLAVVEPIDVVTGYYETGMVNGQHRMVPSVTLKLRNRSAEPIRGVEMLAVFRQVNDEKNWGEHYGWAIRQPLAAGASTPDIVMRSEFGFTGDDPPLKIMESRLFVDALVRVMVRKGSQQWVLLAEYRIPRQLVTR